MKHSTTQFSQIQQSKTGTVDGQVFVGPRGALVINLTPESATRSPASFSPRTFRLLPLEDARLATQAAVEPGRVLWVSTRPPRQVAGLLAEDYQGVWLEGANACVHLGNETRLIRLSPADIKSQDLAGLLARILAECWVGNAHQERKLSGRGQVPRNQPLQMCEAV